MKAQEARAQVQTISMSNVRSSGAAQVACGADHSAFLDPQGRDRHRSAPRLRSADLVDLVAIFRLFEPKMVV